MRVLLRCDGGPEIGVGHVVRSLALAQVALGRGHSVDLLGRIEGELLESLIAGTTGLTVVGTPDRGSALAEVAGGYDVVHLDHYELGTEVLADLAAAAGHDRPLLSSMVDGRFGARPADLLVDPTVGAEREHPPAAARWHLRGSRFTPVRGVVRAGSAPAGDSPLTVLVVMGGTDPTGCAPLVVEALAQVGPPLDVTVVSVAETAEQLASLGAMWTSGRLRVTAPVPDLLARMAAADVVVTAAGTSTWEVCALGRPMALVAAVDNQRAGHDRVVAAGGAIGLGGPDDLADVPATTARLRPLLTDTAVRERVARAAHRLVDGLGAWRVVSAWEAARTAAEPRAVSPAVAVRPATLQDAEALWHWRNDSLTRAMSRHQGMVPFDDHLSWLRASVDRPDRHLLVGTAGGVEVGTVRWDLESGAEWEVSITLAPEARGRGVAPGLLRAGEIWLSRTTVVDAYLAVVRTDNLASRRLFLHGGYAPDLPANGEGLERWVRTVR